MKLNQCKYTLNPLERRKSDSVLNGYYVLSRKSRSGVYQPFWDGLPPSPPHTGVLLNNVVLFDVECSGAAIVSALQRPLESRPYVTDLFALGPVSQKTITAHSVSRSRVEKRLVERQNNLESVFPLDF